MAAAGTSFRNEVRGNAKVKERERQREQKRRQLEQQMAELCSAKPWWKLTSYSGCAVTWVCERWRGDPRRASVKTGVRERGGASLPVAQQTDFSLFLLQFVHSKKLWKAGYLAAGSQNRLFFLKRRTKMGCWFKTKGGSRDKKKSGFKWI